MARLFTLAMLPALIALTLAAEDEDASLYKVTEEAWFDVRIEDLDGPGQDYSGRFKVGLFGDTVPMTVLNFASLAKGYKKGKTNIGYKNSPIHRIVQDFVIQMGDFNKKDGTGGLSIFGERFDDENFKLSHRSAGMIAMANHGENTNGSQFYILLNKSRWLDGKHVVFGKVIEGMDVIRTIGDVPANPNTAVPNKKVIIVDSGSSKLDSPYILTDDQIDSNEDL